MKTEEFEMIAKTFQGLEAILAKELTDLGAGNVKVLKQGVGFTGDLEMLYKANFYCRTALRILRPLCRFKAENTDEVYEKVREFDWTAFVDPSRTLAVDSVVFSDNFKHSKFLAYRVKDAIADFFYEKIGKKPSVRVVRPDLQLNIHVDQDDCTLSIDSSGESLHKRGYRVAQIGTPLNEVMAAGLLLLAGWNGKTNLLDPMCGSGTILIEAAMIALNIAPGLYRSEFAFERWSDFDKEMFERLYNDESKERRFYHKIYGSDISPKAIAAAEKNIKNAGLGKYISLEVAPFQNLSKPAKKTMLLFEPSHYDRSDYDLYELYATIGAKLKRHYIGMNAWVFVIPGAASEKIGLHSSQKIKLSNGATQYELWKYEIFNFKEKKNDFVRYGGTLRR